MTQTTVEERQSLAARLKSQPPREAARMLAAEEPARAVEVLAELNPGIAQDVLAELPADALAAISRAASPEVAKQWLRNARYPQEAIGRLMEPAYAVFSPGHERGRGDRAAARRRAHGVRHLRLRHGRARASSSASSRCGTSSSASMARSWAT